MMLQIEDLKQELQAQQPKIEYLKEALGYENLLKEKRELDEYKTGIKATEACK